jgi:pectin methylesterase-like acyl-CoA thioesterase
MKFQKAFAVIGAGVILFAATDAVTYAATGSSLVLGQLNQANSVTTIQTTSTGSALQLLTAPSSPPMAVNGRGKVVNLYADRAAVADNASKLGGKTVAQVVASVRPAGVIWVAKSGGQFTSLSAALASITNNGPEQRYVIKVAPGTYTETASVVLKNYVDVEGSGQGVTTITCACGSNTAPVFSTSSAVLRVTGPGLHVSVRGFTVNNTGSNLNYSTGIWTGSAVPGNVSLDDVTVTATGGTVNYGIHNSGSSSPTMTNVTATATSGASAYGIFNGAGSSPTMTNVTATGTGGTVSYGVFNSGSSPTMTNVTATGTGGTANYGIYNSGSSPTMTNVTATGTGGTVSYGVFHDGGSVLIRDSFLTGSTFSVRKASGTIRILNTVFNGNTSGVGAAACIGALTTQLNDYTCL